MTDFIARAILKRNGIIVPEYGIARIAEYENCWRIETKKGSFYQISKFDERCLRVGGII